MYQSFKNGFGFVLGLAAGVVVVTKLTQIVIEALEE